MRRIDELVQVLAEVLDKSYPWKIVRQSGTSRVFVFKTQDDRYFNVYVRMTPETVKKNGKEQQWMSFTIGFMDDEQSSSTTNKGDAFRIFSTVGDIVLTSLESYRNRITRIEFKGLSERGRESLYEKLAERVRAEFDLTSVSVERIDGKTGFVVSI